MYVELLLIISIVTLLCLSVGLFLYALYLRRETEKRNRLLLRKTPKWRWQVEKWLAEKVLLNSRESHPKEFLRYLYKECENFTQAERKQLGAMLVAMGLVRQIRELMQVSNPAIKAWAIHLVGYLEIEELKEEVMAYQGDPAPLVSYAANISMARLIKPEEPQYYALLHRLVANFEYWTTQKLGEVVILMGPEAGKELLRLVENGYAKGKLLWFIIDIMGEMQLQEAGEVLLELIKNDRETAVHAIRSLGLMGYPKAIYPLMNLLDHPDWIIRAQAARALGSFQGTEAVAALEKAMHNPVWWVRHNAAKSLLQLGELGVSCLKKIVKTSNDTYAVDMANFTLREMR